jgi:hypothetical protein
VTRSRWGVRVAGIPRPRIRVGHETMFAAMCQTRDKTHRCDAQPPPPPGPTLPLPPPANT